MGMMRVWLGGALVLLLALAYHLPLLGEMPPGLDRDAAANGLQALHWLREGIVPFWMPHASAPEPLIVWLQTATTALLGPSVVALRSASALFLSFAALVVYLLTLEVARYWSASQRWWAALLAGVIFACNPVITQLARTGLRATTLPLLSGLLFWLLLRAWRTDARRDYLLSGVVLGLAAYTYLAARFLPIVLLLFVLLAWWMERGQRGDVPLQAKPRTRLMGLLLMGCVALIVVLPQLLFFARYPSAFFERAASVSLLSNPAYSEMGLADVLLEKARGLALSFGVAWSGQYNQAARALLLPLPFVGLLLALPLVVRWRRQPGMLLMVVAWGVMLLPDVIGGDRLQPHELRVIGAFVPVMVLCGVGLAFGLGWLARFFKSKVITEVMGALLALVIAGWGFWDWYGLAVPALAKSEYDWFARPEVAIAEAINAKDTPLLVPLHTYSHSVVAYLSAARATQLRSGIDASGTVVTPSTAQVLLLWPADPERMRVESTSYRFDPANLVLIDAGRAYLMPPATVDVAQVQQECGAQPFATPTGEAAGALCEVDFAAFEFPAQLPELLWPVNDLYDGALRLHGINADRRVLVAGEEVGITSYWQAAQPGNARWRYFVHLLDDRQTLVAGDDLIPGYGIYGTQLWRMDEIVPVRQRVQLPEKLSAGRYWIEVGLYDPLTGERAVVEATGTDRSLVGPLKVPLDKSAALPDVTPLAARFGDELALQGYRLEQETAELQLTLQFAALRQPQQDYTLFVHVENVAGEIVAQTDAQPFGGAYPTAIWDAGEVVVAGWRVTLPADLSSGNYRIWIGWYEWQSGTRLPVHATDAPVDADRLLLHELTLP